MVPHSPSLLTYGHPSGSGPCLQATTTHLTGAMGGINLIKVTQQVSTGAARETWEPTEQDKVGGDMSDQADGGYASPELLADTEWLAAHLSDENLRIVDTDVSAAYQRGHIHESVLIPDNYEKDPDTHAVHILPPAKFAEMMESLGIGDDTLVVAYDNSQSLYAGRLWWALRYYGHSGVKVLNGGWRKWVREGRPISIDRPQPKAGLKFTPEPDDSLIITTEELKEIYNNPENVVWDVRNRAEFTGAMARRNRRPGHIPGATHLDWAEMMDPDTYMFKPAEEMRRILKSNGITPESEVLTH